MVLESGINQRSETNPTSNRRAVRHGFDVDLDDESGPFGGGHRGGDIGGCVAGHEGAWIDTL